MLYCSPYVVILSSCSSQVLLIIFANLGLLCPFTAFKMTEKAIFLKIFLAFALTKQKQAPQESLSLRQKCSSSSLVPSQSEHVGLTCAQTF